MNNKKIKLVFMTMAMLIFISGISLAESKKWQDGIYGSLTMELKGNPAQLDLGTVVALSSLDEYYALTILETTNVLSPTDISQFLTKRNKRTGKLEFVKRDPKLKLNGVWVLDEEASSEGSLFFDIYVEGSSGREKLARLFFIKRQQEENK